MTPIVLCFCHAAANGILNWVMRINLRPGLPSYAGAIFEDKVVF